MNPAVYHYRTSSGREPVKEFIASLSTEARNEVFTLLRQLEDGEVLSMPHSRALSSIAPGLNELRVRDRAGQIRIFYYLIRGGHIILLHALRKKSRVISEQDRWLLRRRINEVKHLFKR